MFKEFNKLQMAYTILLFYAILMMVTATLGYKMDKQHGFTNGYIVGIVISLGLWFTVGKQMSKL